MMSCSKYAASTSLCFLPEDILVQILRKLPTKSLVRFRCVSKFFCSLLVDHPFADMHRNWCLTLPSRMSILIFFTLSSRPCYYTLNYPPQENQGTLHVNHRLRYMYEEGDLFRNVYLRSAVNGLLCFCRNPPCRDDSVVIHNLSTKSCVSLPTPLSLPLNSSLRMNICGLLGFDLVSRRYKVLKSVQFTDHSDRHVTVKHSVFTLGVDKSWREIPSSFEFHPQSCFTENYINSFYFRTSVHIDGVIYWINSLNYAKFCQFHIVAFNVAAENFRTIPSPPWHKPPHFQKVGLMEMDGQLAILDYRKSEESGPYFHSGIWILEDLVWKKHMIPIPIPITKICQLHFGSNHVGEISDSSLLFYNFTRQSWRTFDTCRYLRPPNCFLVLWSTAMHFIVDNVF